MLKPQFEAGKSQTSVYSRGLRDQKPMISRRESQNPTRRSNDYVAKGFDLSESERAGSESQAYAGSRWKHKGVIKNDRIRRDVLKDFETWTKKLFIIKDKSDSLVHGEKGNSERFYLLNKL